MQKVAGVKTKQSHLHQWSYYLSWLQL